MKPIPASKNTNASANRSSAMSTEVFSFAGAAKAAPSFTVVQNKTIKQAFAFVPLCLCVLCASLCGRHLNNAPLDSGKSLYN